MKTTELRSEGRSEEKVRVKHTRKQKKPTKTQRHKMKVELEVPSATDANSDQRDEMSHDSMSTTSSDPGPHREEEEQRSWQLVDKFAIRPPVSLPFLTGCTLHGSTLIRDLWSDELHLTNLKEGTTKEAFVNKLKGDVFFCATLGEDKMVYCDSKSGLVHICTLEGDHLKTIAITHRPSTHMYHVTVDKDNRIVFGVRDGKIFIIDPQDGKIVSSFGVDCKIEAIDVTASGYIVIKSGIAKFNVIWDGVIVHTITNDAWSWAACVGHPTEDVLYVAYSRRDDDDRRRLMEVSPNGEVIEDCFLGKEETPHHLLQPSMAITKSLQIVICDNGKLLVFTKNA